LPIAHLKKEKKDCILNVIQNNHQRSGKHMKISKIK